MVGAPSGRCPGRPVDSARALTCPGPPGWGEQMTVGRTRPPWHAFFPEATCVLRVPTTVMPSTRHPV